MTLFIISFIAGVLTVLSPCILPLLPVVIGGSVADGKKSKTPIVIVLSLMISVFVFTLLLKFLTIFVDIPTAFWKIFSGTVLIVFALTIFFPIAWAKLSTKFKLKNESNRFLAKVDRKDGYKRDVLIGIALGPVFSTCSPTYFVIIGTVLPASFFVGLIYLLAYVTGLGLILFIVAYLGKKVMKTLIKASDPKGWFKKTLGIIFLVLGISIIFGLDKKFETILLDTGWGNIANFEQGLLEKFGIE